MIWIAVFFGTVHLLATFVYQFSSDKPDDVKQLYIRTHTNGALIWLVIGALAYKEIFPV